MPSKNVSPLTLILLIWEGQRKQSQKKNPGNFSTLCFYCSFSCRDSRHEGHLVAASFFSNPERKIERLCRANLKEGSLYVDSISNDFFFLLKLP